MKVLDLHCAHGHRFEGWFGSDADYSAQMERSLVECPVCGDHAIQRLPSAPRLNLGAQPAPVAPAGSSSSAAPPQAVMQGREMQGLWMQMMRRVLETTEDVGPRFAEEARRIHHGEADERAIRGQATPEETEALRDEGIEVMPLPVPPALKGPLQ